jgi:hypothetical protein
MSAVCSFAVAPAAAGRVAPVRRASRASAFAGAESKRALTATSRRHDVNVCRARGAVAVTAASRDPRDSPIVRANNGAAPAREPVADVGRVTSAFAQIAQTLWAARKGFVAIAFAMALCLLDPAAAVAGRGGRSGGRMGGSSFRSTSRSMGSGMGGMGGMGAGAGAGAMGAGRAGAAGASGAAGAGAANYGPRAGLGMPSFFFMPSFGYGYGWGMGGGFIMMKVLMQIFLMYMVYSYLFGGRGGRGAGGNAAY